MISGQFMCVMRSYSDKQDAMTTEKCIGNFRAKPDSSLLCLSQSLLAPEVLPWRVLVASICLQCHISPHYTGGCVSCSRQWHRPVD